MACARMCDFSEVIQMCVMMVGSTMPLLERVTISYHVIISHEPFYVKLLRLLKSKTMSQQSPPFLRYLQSCNSGFFVALRCSLSHLTTNDNDVAGILSQDVNGRPHSYVNCLNVTFVSQSSNDSVDSSGRFSQHSDRTLQSRVNLKMNLRLMKASPACASA